MNGSDFTPMAYMLQSMITASSFVVTKAHMVNYGTFEMLFTMVFFATIQKIALYYLFPCLVNFDLAILDYAAPMIGAVYSKWRARE